MIVDPKAKTEFEDKRKVRITFLRDLTAALQSFWITPSTFDPALPKQENIVPWLCTWVSQKQEEKDLLVVPSQQARIALEDVDKALWAPIVEYLTSLRCMIVNHCLTLVGKAVNSCYTLQAAGLSLEVYLACGAFRFPASLTKAPIKGRGSATQEHLELLMKLTTEHIIQMRSVSTSILESTFRDALDAQHYAYESVAIELTAVNNKKVRLACVPFLLPAAEFMQAIAEWRLYILSEKQNAESLGSIVGAQGRNDIRC